MRDRPLSLGLTNRKLWQSRWPEQSLQGSGCPSLWHFPLSDNLSFPLSGNLGKWEEDPLGEKMTISDMGNLVRIEDLKISDMCGHCLL